MRHQKHGRKFHRMKGQRQALFKSVMSNLVMRGGIQTTEAKAKEIRPRVEKLITLGKKQNIATLRILMSRLPKSAAEKIYYELSPRYKENRGGYTRIIKAGKARKDDSAKMARIEFI